MKKFTLSLGVILAFFSLNQLMAQEPAVKQATVTHDVKAPVAQPVDAQQTTTAVFEFDDETFNFGEITQGDVVEHVFKFKNVGDEPLKIQNVKVTCGCTTPSYSKSAIAPGESGEIDVKFNSRGKMGMQMKSITIYYGADMPKVIYLKGEVKPVPVDAGDGTN